MPTTTVLSLTYPSDLDPATADLWGAIINAVIVALDGEFGTKTVNQNFADKELRRPILRDYGEKLGTASFSSGTLTLDLTTGNHFKHTLTANVTSVVISNPSPTGNLCPVTIKFKQDGTGGRTVAGWPSAVKWASGTAPTITATANLTDFLTLLTDDAGTTYLGIVTAQGVTGL